MYMNIPQATIHDIGTIMSEYFWEFKSKDCVVGMLLKSLILHLIAKMAKTKF